MEIKLFFILSQIIVDKTEKVYYYKGVKMKTKEVLYGPKTVVNIRRLL